MQPSQQIKLLCLKCGISLSELARRLGKSPQSFTQKLNRENLNLNDIDNIATVTGCKIECSFIMQNGEKVKIKG